VAAISAGGVHSLAIYTPAADSTAPTTSASTIPASPNAFGWYNQHVSVTLSASDTSGGSGVKSISYSASGAQTIAATTLNAASASVSITTEGTTTLSYSAADNAGNTETAKTLTIKLDATKPSVSYSGNAGTYTVDQTITISCTASDTLSGIASSSCATISGPAYAFALGTNTRSASATDVAGNTGSGSTTFTVGVTFDSLCRLSASFSTDSTVDTGLCDKLAAAKAAAANGDTKTKNNNLAAYRQQVAAQSGKALTKQQATLLTNLSKAL
jgi:hypothetical protein